MEQLNSLKEVIDEADFPQAPTLVSKAQQEYDVLKNLFVDDHKQQLTIKTIEDIELAHFKNKIQVKTTLM